MHWHSQNSLNLVLLSPCPFLLQDTLLQKHPEPPNKSCWEGAASQEPKLWLMIQSNFSAKAQECQDFCLGGWVKLIHLQDSVTAWYLLRGEVRGSKGMGNTSAALGKFLACFIQRQEWLGLQKPCTEKSMLAKLQLSRQGCIEYLKSSLTPSESEAVYVPWCLGSCCSARMLPCFKELVSPWFTCLAMSATSSLPVARVGILLLLLAAVRAWGALWIFWFSRFKHTGSYHNNQFVHKQSQKTCK